MQKSIQQLREIVEKYAPLLTTISDKDLSFKPGPQRWSNKEIFGHLIDSSQNNIRRFVVSQYEVRPTIMYAQNNWVSSADYQNYPTGDLISLWMLLNKHLCVILKNIPQGAEEKQCMTNELRTIKWLAEDYNKHLLHHLHQILNLEPIAYP